MTKCPRCKCSDFDDENTHELPIGVIIDVCLDCFKDWLKVFHAKFIDLEISEIVGEYYLKQGVSKEGGLQVLRDNMREQCRIKRELTVETFEWLEAGV